MALVAVGAAKGSPGVTTTALLIGALWPRPVVVAECDPAGSDVALRMPGEDGGVLDRDRGLLSLVAAGRKHMHHALVAQHCQQILGGLDVLCGIRVPEQAGGLAHQWQLLGPLLAAIPGADVVADLGRVGVTTPQNALLTSASDVVLVCDTTPSAVVHLRERASAISGLFDTSGTGPRARLHVVVVAEHRRTQAVRDVKDTLQRAELRLASVVHLSRDDRGAGFFAGRAEGRADRTALVRSGIGFVAELARGAAPSFVRDATVGQGAPGSDPVGAAPPPPAQPLPPDAGSRAALRHAGGKTG